MVYSQHVKSTSKKYEKMVAKIAENQARGLHFGMLLCLGACPGTPWRPSWDRDPKNLKKITFWDPHFGAHLWQMLVLLRSRFLHVFQTLYFHPFCSGRRSQVSIEPVFGLLRTPNWWISGKSETIKKQQFLLWFKHIQPLHSAIISMCFVVLMCIFWFLYCCVYCFNYFVKFNTFVSPPGLHFSTHFQHFWASIFVVIFSSAV